ncbi:MAG: hypothetical protein V4666_07735 [Bacteroidota bacterium]
MKTQTSKTKNLKIFVIALFLGLFIIPETSFAQPPRWAPAHGYRAKTRYIYFPQHNFYYDIRTHNYLYLNGRNWSVSVAIPAPFISINLGTSTQVQLDYYGGYPYYYNYDHRVKYKVVSVKQPKYKRHQVIFAKEKHGNGHGFKHNGHGNGKGHGKGHGKKH